MEETAAPAEEVIVTDRSVENPWVVETIGRGGVMLDVGCLGSDYLGEMAARADRACGLDIQAVPPVEGVQIFTPTPMTRSTCMYHTGKDPITGEAVYVPRPYAEKKAQKRMLGSVTEE